MTHRSIKLLLALTLLLSTGSVALSSQTASAAPEAPAAPMGVGDASCFAPGPHGFSDVPTGGTTGNAVAWLVEAGITQGTAPGIYSPNANVTRGHMAIFLWRNAGQPAPQSMAHGFSDVPTSGTTATAVAWLVEAGITQGTAPGIYSPNAQIIRGHMAIFLWRNACTPPDIELAAGQSHTCAIKPNSAVAC